MKRILFAGGAGNLGSSIVKELERRAQKVRIMSRKSAPKAIGSARCTQLHSFLDFLLSPLREVIAEEIAIPVDMQFQPISTADVASHLAPHIIGGDTIGRLTDFGGPEVLKLRDMAAAWLDIQHIKRAIRPATGSRTDLPYFNAFADGFLKGYNTNPDNRIGRMTWGDYLRQTYRL